MSLTALDALQHAFAGLRIALDGDDMVAVEKAAATLHGATEQVRAAGVWRDEPALRTKLGEIQPLMEAARIRANILADQTRQRISLLVERGVQGAQLTYSR